MVDIVRIQVHESSLTVPVDALTVFDYVSQPTLSPLAGRYVHVACADCQIVGMIKQGKVDEVRLEVGVLEFYGPGSAAIWEQLLEVFRAFSGGILNCTVYWSNDTSTRVRIVDRAITTRTIA